MIDLTVLCPLVPDVEEMRLRAFLAGAEYALAHVETSKGLILRERVRAVKRELKELKGQAK